MHARCRPVHALILTLFAGLASCASDAPDNRQSTIPHDADDLARARGAGDKESIRLEPVAFFTGPMPTGVAVSHKGRVFLSFPRWGDPVEMTVAELVNGELVPYPSIALNRLSPQEAATSLVSVQSVVVDPADRLWLLDSGNINLGPNLPGGPKLVGVDLRSNLVFRTIQFHPTVALKTTYLNDVRFDLRRGAQGTAFITDSSSDGLNGIIVVDLATGNSLRRLHEHPSTRSDPGFAPIVEGEPLLDRPRGGKPSRIKIGADGLALSPDGETLYYRPLMSHHLYGVSARALADASASDALVASTVKDFGDLGFASDGLEADSQGRLYLTDYEHQAIRTLHPGETPATLVTDPRMIWPDTLALGASGYLYVTVNQLDRQPRFHAGQDLRKAPYALFRVHVNALPVGLGVRP
jgi:sugar lactone lactonase YvrE